MMKTKKDKEISRLLELFMEGNTTVEQEDVLARYFSNHDVPSEWSEYKEMFDYFADGMPRGRYDDKPCEVKKRRKGLWMAAAAAVAAILIVMAWPDDTLHTAGHHDTGTILTAAVADTTVSDTGTPADTASVPVVTGPARRKRTLRKYRSVMAAPKVYLAAADDAAAMPRDTMSAADMVVNARIHDMEMAQRALFEDMAVMQQVNEVVVAMMEEGIDIEEIAGTEEIY